MKINLFHAIIFLLIVNFLLSCEDDCPNQTVNSSCLLKGIVIDAKTNAPLSQVFISTEPPSASVITDINGEFAFELQRSGSYFINAMKSGYYTNKTTASVAYGKTTKTQIILHDSSYSNHTPNKPILIFPSNNSKRSTTVELSWECTDADNDPLTFTVYLDTNPNPSKLYISMITQKKVTLTNLIPDKTYFWKISACDKYGAMSESEIYKFTIDTTYKNISDWVLYFNFDYNSVYNSSYSFNYTSNINTYINDRNNIPYQAAYFQGSNFININRTQELELTTEFTIAVWLKPDSEYGVNNNGWIQLIGRWKNTGTAASTYCLEINLASKKIIGCTHNGSTNSLCYSNSILQTGVWTHVAFTYKSGSAKIYFNGLLNSSSSAVAPQLSNYPFLVGMQDDGVNAYKGAMDDLYLFNRALTDDEILNLAK